MSPKERAKAEKLRRAGGFTMATGGVIGLVGIALTIGYTSRGNIFDKELNQAREQFTAENCSRQPGKASCDAITANVGTVEDKVAAADNAARYSGIAVLSGLAVVAVGGVLYRLGTKRLKRSEFVLAPSFGGAVLSGRF